MMTQSIAAGVRTALASLAILLCLVTAPALAQSATSGGNNNNSADGSASAPQQAGAVSHPGDVGAGVKKALAGMDNMRNGLISGATALSDRVRVDSDKVAFGLGVIAILFAGLRFASTSDAVAAWTDMIETILILGIFTALYIGYTDFGPGIFVWFDKLASSFNGGVSVYDLPATLASTGGKFYDSIVRILRAALGNPLRLVDALIAALAFLFAMVAVLCAALIYAWFILVGHLMVAVGIAIGPLAVAFGMLDLSRKYFFAWLDYMVTGSMYMVIAAIIAQLVSSTLQSTVTDITNVGTDTTVAAAYALSVAVVLVFIAMEIPKIAGSIFGTGGGISATGGFKMLGRGAWNLGSKLAGKSK
ncbi:type IV secretion system protein [Cupriavidus plantarum]|uniref:type IV secretion system protein n=1 Tax=Cupriavidus plantarum TaxID=942865 RepID=UPI00339D79C9